jgi:Transposase IS66 family
MRLLEGFTGILQTDGYETYCAVAEARQLVHAGCFAYVRRRFEDARTCADPGKNSHAKIALDLIGQLYRIEREIKTAKPDERVRVRQSQSAKILAGLKTWLDKMVELVLPRSALGNAIHYALSQWPKLQPFLIYPEIPLDTNRTENAIRPLSSEEKAGSSATPSPALKPEPSSILSSGRRKRMGLSRTATSRCCSTNFPKPPPRSTSSGSCLGTSRRPPLCRTYFELLSSPKSIAPPSSHRCTWSISSCLNASAAAVRVSLSASRTSFSTASIGT